MADTQRSLAAVLALLADNTSKDLSPQDIRDTVVSLQNDHGQVYEIGNASATVITNTTSFFVANLSGTTLSTSPHNFDSPSSGRLRYTGAADRFLHIACSISFTSASNNQVIYIDLGKNGTVGGESEMRRRINTGTDVGSTALHWITQVSNNDYIELFVRNSTSATNVTIECINLQAIGMII
jgi:hypothetical protein